MNGRPLAEHGKGGPGGRGGLAGECSIATGKKGVQPPPARHSGRVIGRPKPPFSAGNGPRPSGLDREGWVRVRHSRPEWLAHPVGPRVPRQCQDSTRLNTFSIKPSTVLALARRCLGNGLPDQRPRVQSVERCRKAKCHQNSGLRQDGAKVLLRRVSGEYLAPIRRVPRCESRERRGF